MAKMTATIKLKKRFKLHLWLMPRIIVSIYFINSRIGQHAYDRYMNYMEKNINKYIKVIY